MRWSKNIRPKEGDTKLISKFAWIPTLVGDTWYWLETYDRCYIWTEVRGYGLADIPSYQWVPVD